MPQSNSLAITKSGAEQAIKELDKSLAAVFMGIKVTDWLTECWRKINNRYLTSEKIRSQAGAPWVTGQPAETGDGWAVPGVRPSTVRQAPPGSPHHQGLPGLQGDGGLPRLAGQHRGGGHQGCRVSHDEDRGESGGGGQLAGPDNFRPELSQLLQSVWRSLVEVGLLTPQPQWLQCNITIKFFNLAEGGRVQYFLPEKNILNFKCFYRTFK